MPALLAYQLFFPINAAEKAIVVAESLGWNGELDHICAIGLRDVGIQNPQHPCSIPPSQKVVFADLNHVSYVKSHTASSQIALKSAKRHL
jgi:hypothetical protein